MLNEKCITKSLEAVYIHTSNLINNKIRYSKKTTFNYMYFLREKIYMVKGIFLCA